jgi:uncharacterized protein (TIGR00297 family)
LAADLLTGIFLALLISAIAWYRQWLSGGGAMAATCMGTFVWVAGGWQVALPLLLFFISSSILSLALRSSIAGTDKKDRQPRDAMQVICNGGVAMICLLLFFLLQKQVWYWAYWASIAVSTADTWSSTIGNRYAKKVIDVMNGKTLAKGLSGGISIVGTLGGLAGGGLIAITGLLVNGAEFGWISVLLTGFAGMILDSILGSLFQARYRLSDGRQVEFEPSVGIASLEKGWSWLTNDWVNLLSNLLVTAGFCLVFFS